jgi:hypothetical protein
MITPLYKKLKKNGTTLYVFPSVEEDKNFEHNNENYRMFLSHYVLLKLPRQITNEKLDFDNTFEQNPTSIQPASYKDQLVESLRNYIANHEATIRNSKINNTDFYYDTFELNTTTEKIFWKWCKKLGIIDLEPADNINEYFGADNKYDDNGTVGNTDFFREYLWRERNTDPVAVLDVQFSLPVITVPAILPVVTVGMQQVQIILTASSTIKVGDQIILNIPNIDVVGGGYSLESSLLNVVGLATTNTINDTLIVEIDDAVILADFGNIAELEVFNYYERFVQFVCEVGGLNNVQLPNKAYTESFAYISNQHGQIPYTLFQTNVDNNYKPGSQWPILPQEIQAEIQGGQNPNNPILTNSNLYPGDIWAQFDTSGFLYTTAIGDDNRRSGDYFGVFAANNNNPTLKYPDFDGETIDGLQLNLNINDYAKAVSYVYPINTFNEFCATPFNNEPPKDFEFNAILWYYTVEDVTGNNIDSATNIYGIEFLDTPENDIDPLKTKIPFIQKLVSNGYQNGNSYTFSLDTNISVESDTNVPTFDVEKIYSLFGMELYYEALTRLTYFNDKVTDLINNNLQLNQKVNNLTGLVYTQQDLESIRNRMLNIENLLQVYSTLQIGASDTIIPILDTSVNPPLLRLHSIDKRYGNIYQYKTKTMFSEFENINGLTQYSINEKIIPVQNGKDFLTIINNNDNSIPTPAYDTTLLQENLSIVIEKDLSYKQVLDILILPEINEDPITPTNLTNLPVNDKKINISINYNDGVNIINESIGKFNLPVLGFYDGSVINSESISLLNDTPLWKIKKVFYSKANTNNRVFSLLIEDDLLNISAPALQAFIAQHSRIFVNNFIIEQNPLIPSNIYEDYSGQYRIYTQPELVPSQLLSAEIVVNGTGYGSNVTVTDIITINTIPVVVVYSTNSLGEIINVNLLSSALYTTQLDLAGSYTISGGNGDAEIRLITNPVTMVSFNININLDPAISAILTNYDDFTDINNKPLNQLFDISKMFKNMPDLTLLKGFMISISRVSTIENIPVSQLDKRYKININKL